MDSENNKLDFEPEKVRKINRGGLYGPQPIPAQMVLAHAREFKAQRLLLCLSSYLGDINDRCVFPTYHQIQYRSQLTHTSISKALSVLVDFGFIKVFSYWKNGKKLNKYYFQDACWHNYKMNEVARKYSPDLGICDCGKTVKEGEIVFGTSDYHHFDCGGVVQLAPNATRYKEKLARARAKALKTARNGNLSAEE